MISIAMEMTIVLILVTNQIAQLWLPLLQVFLLSLIQSIISNCLIKTDSILFSIKEPAKFYVAMEIVLRLTNFATENMTVLMLQMNEIAVMLILIS